MDGIVQFPNTFSGNAPEWDMYTWNKSSFTITNQSVLVTKQLLSKCVLNEVTLLEITPNHSTSTN